MRTVDDIAYDLLAAYWRADGSAHQLEAELDAATGNRSTPVLLRCAARCREARPSSLHDPGLTLAHRSTVPGPPLPVERCAGPRGGTRVDRLAPTVPNSLCGGRRDLTLTGFLCALCVSMVMPALLAYGMWRATR